MRPERNVDRRGTARWFRALCHVALCGLLVAALSACRTIVVVPGDESWTVTGQEEHAVATWETETVTVRVPLELRGDATMLTGSLRNAGAAPVFVVFGPSAEVERKGLSGTLSGPRTKGDGRWTAPLVPWRTIEVPAGTRESPGTVEFALSPDKPWTARTVPDLGATITWVIHVADESGETECPVFFHVGAATPGWVDDPRTAAAVTLVALAGLIVWAAYL